MLRAGVLCLRILGPGEDAEPGVPCNPGQPGRLSG
jgi:hypothetical protein